MVQKWEIVSKKISSFRLPFELPIWIVFDSLGSISTLPLLLIYFTKLYKSSFLSSDKCSNASVSATTIKFFLALVTATLVISALFFNHSNVFLLVLGDMEEEIIIVSFSAPCTECIFPH